MRIVAPDQNRSGAARSITMHSPLWVEEVELPDGSLAYSTDGTPVDCVRMAALGLLDRTPDLIVSGINLGGNLGDDITYSGTVAAAFEGIMLDIPAIALSAEGYHPGYDLTVPARFAHRLVSIALRRGLPGQDAPQRQLPRPVVGGAAGRAADHCWASASTATRCEYRETKGNRRGYHIYNDDLSYHHGTGNRFRSDRRRLGVDHSAPFRSHVARGSGPAARLGERWLLDEADERGARIEAQPADALPAYQAVVFDLDGTVVDSVELIIMSFQHAIREVLGREISREESIAWVGRPLREQMVMFSPEHADELVDVYREFNHREHDRMLKLYDGILHLLDGLQTGRREAGPGDLQVALHHADGLRPHRHRELLRRHRLRRREPGQQALARPHPPLPGAAGGRAGRGGLRGRQSRRTSRRPRPRGVDAIAVTWGVFAAETLEAEKPDILVHTIPELAEVLGHLGAAGGSVADETEAAEAVGGGADRGAAGARPPSRVPLLRARQPRDLRRRLRRPLPRAAGAGGGSSRAGHARLAHPARGRRAAGGLHPGAARRAHALAGQRQERGRAAGLARPGGQAGRRRRAWDAGDAALRRSSPRSTAWPCRCATRTAGWRSGPRGATARWART